VRLIVFSSRNNDLDSILPKTMKALPLFHPYGSLSVPVWIRIAKIKWLFNRVIWWNFERS